MSEHYVAAETLVTALAAVASKKAIDRDDPEWQKWLRTMVFYETDIALKLCFDLRPVLPESFIEWLDSIVECTSLWVARDGLLRKTY